MKNPRILVVLAVLSLGLALQAANAATTWTSSNTGAFKYSLATTTTGAEVATPSASTDGTPVEAGKSITVTVVRHLIVNVSTDVGYYDPTGAGDASAGDAAANTFGPDSTFYCWFYDTLLSAWTRYPAGDFAGDPGGTGFTKESPVFPRAGRYAYTSAFTNVPVKIYLSIR